MKKEDDKIKCLEKGEKKSFNRFHTQNKQRANEKNKAQN